MDKELADIVETARAKNPEQTEALMREYEDDVADVNDFAEEERFVFRTPRAEVEEHREELLKGARKALRSALLNLLAQ